MLFIHSGEISIKLNGGNPTGIRKGQGLLIFPETSFYGESVAEQSKASVHHFHIHEAAEGASRSVLQKFIGKNRGYEFLDTAGNSLIDRDLDRSLRLSEQPSNKLTRAMQSNLLCLALAQLQIGREPISSSTARKTRILLQQLATWLTEHLTASISVDAMAARVSLSGSHLRRVFRVEFGMGPSQYFQELKMREARRLLRESAMPIKVISSHLGFGDLAHFYRSFRNHTQMAPAEYRNRHCPIG